MEGLRLSEAERIGVKIPVRKDTRTSGAMEQAIGRVMTDKPVYCEALRNALGPIWCPMKGIEVKELGENRFLFSFLQASGKKKAVDNGPWMLDKNLVVMEEFIASKTIDEYEFSKIPIWVRVSKLPLGDMNQETAVLIGNRIGEFLEVDGLEDGMAVGQYL
jgi:hypothetical protein